MMPSPAHSDPSPPNSQVILQFLSSVLSQRGPYAEDTKWLIRQHLVSLTTAFPSLVPRTATFTHNDGRSVNLLQSDGTVPMSFQGVTYNIPVVIWLMESYPRHPPCVYVNPTRDMIIKRHHPHVNPSGMVSIPYLQDWIYPSSNLVELVRNLSVMFGRDPPLYSQRRPNPSPSHNPNPSPSPSSSFGRDSANSSLASNMGAAAFQRPVIPPRGYPPLHTEDPNEVFKRNAINKLVETVHNDIVGIRKTMEAEMEGLFSAQGALKQREEELNKGLKEMQDEKEALEQKLQMVLMNSDVLEAWVRENEGMISSDFEVDDAFECVDVLSKQILECTASDLAIEDAIYSLDKAVQDGAIQFDQYLRNVRLLSREQFFHRGTAAKVRESQLQAQVANMASRISQYNNG
ncbi:protein ELC-like [Cucurbita moschata]|uniref:Protein ELC-like n=1 Tax=Cucurbita moschata TaxID=3662 RepID=A0A6J1FZX0_CUCMO|nr:protein ELC-like [Cucurbita moschata]XP_022945114.1 protein ELC-like [Cucurbita moschata]